MRTPLSNTIVAALIALLCGGGAHSGELQHNPFKRPEISPQAHAVSTPTKKKTSVARKPRAPAFRLYTTLVAGEDSMANINGKLLSIGDELSGYRLTQVAEREVVMVKRNHRVTVKLKP